jgi:hypothetical protein
MSDAAILCTNIADSVPLPTVICAIVASYAKYAPLGVPEIYGIVDVNDLYGSVSRPLRSSHVMVELANGAIAFDLEGDLAIWTPTSILVYAMGGRVTHLITADKNLVVGTDLGIVSCLMADAPPGRYVGLGVDGRRADGALTRGTSQCFAPEAGCAITAMLFLTGLGLVVAYQTGMVRIWRPDLHASRIIGMDSVVERLVQIAPTQLLGLGQQSCLWDLASRGANPKTLPAIRQIALLASGTVLCRTEKGDMILRDGGLSPCSVDVGLSYSLRDRIELAVTSEDTRRTYARRTNHGPHLNEYPAAWAETACGDLACHRGGAIHIVGPTGQGREIIWGAGVIESFLCRADGSIVGCVGRTVVVWRPTCE